MPAAGRSLQIQRRVVPGQTAACCARGQSEYNRATLDLRSLPRCIGTFAANAVAGLRGNAGGRGLAVDFAIFVRDASEAPAEVLY